MNRISRHSTHSPFASILVLTGAIACSASPASEHSQGAGGAIGGGSGLGGSASGGTATSTNSGGSSSTLVGGDKSTGGASSLPGAGAKSSGGSNSMITGGAKSSGGANSVTTGGTTGGGTSSSNLGGALSTGGSSNVTSTGGSKNTGGTTAVTGGAKSTGGTRAATGGANATGGVNATGGACTTGLPSSCGSNSCDAATPSDPQLTACGALGNVTMYSTSASNNGACGYGTTNVMYYAAINVNLAPGDGLGQWQGGRICGQCMQVTVLTSQGLKSVVVRIMDKCPDGYCGIDLGGSAPAAVMGTDFGRYQGAWSAVPCAGHPEVFDGVPSIYVKDGSNGGWSAIQVRNPMTAVAAIDYQDENNGAISGTMALLTPSIENFFSVPTDVLAGSIIDLTVRYVNGTTATVTLTATQLGTPSTTYPLN